MQLRSIVLLLFLLVPGSPVDALAGTTTAGIADADNRIVDRWLSAPPADLISLDFDLDGPGPLDLGYGGGGGFAEDIIAENFASTAGSPLFSAGLTRLGIPDKRASRQDDPCLAALAGQAFRKYQSREMRPDPFLSSSAGYTVKAAGLIFSVSDHYAWTDDGKAHDGSGSFASHAINSAMEKITTLFTAGSAPISSETFSSTALLFGSGLIGLFGISRKL